MTFLKTEKMIRSEIRETLSDRDGVKLRYGFVQVEGARAERVLLFLCGRHEWIEKYEHLSQELLIAPGTVLITVEHRGQGESGGARGDVLSYDFYADDLGKILGEVGPGLPHAVIGHSMGALIALSAVARGVISPERIVLCSPLLGFAPSMAVSLAQRVAALVLALIGLGDKRIKLTPDDQKTFEENEKTTDEEQFRRLQAQPNKLPGPTIRWINETGLAMGRVFARRFLRSLRAPVLVILPFDERVVDSGAARRWAAKVQRISGVKISLRELSDGESRHELLIESKEIRDRVTSEIRGFLSAPYIDC